MNTHEVEIYSVKQEEEKTAGARRLMLTESSRRRAGARGRFSGTTFSSELFRHGGHSLFSLHLDFPGREAAAPSASRISPAYARSSHPAPTSAKPTADPRMTHATVDTQRSLQLPSLHAVLNPGDLRRQISR